MPVFRMALNTSADMAPVSSISAALLAIIGLSAASACNSELGPSKTGNFCSAEFGISKLHKIQDGLNLKAGLNEVRGLQGCW
jgi:hypothetical protein